MTALHGRLFATETPPSLTRPGFLGYSRGAGRAWNMFFVFGGRSRGDVHMGYNISCLLWRWQDLFGMLSVFVIFSSLCGGTGQAKRRSGAPRGPGEHSRSFGGRTSCWISICVLLCVCRHGQRQRWSVCFWFCSRPEAKASSHTCRRLKPCVVANHSSKHSFTSKTGCESTCFYRDVHTHVV